MFNLETFFIAVYTVVDDIYKENVAPLILEIEMDLSLTLATVR